MKDVAKTLTKTAAGRVTKAATTKTTGKTAKKTAATVARTGSRRAAGRVPAAAFQGTVTHREPAQRSARKGPLDTVLEAFVTEARRSGLAGRLVEISDPEAFGTQLAALADARAAWEVALGRYLSVAEAAKVLGVSSRQAVHQRIARGTLLAMDLAGQTVLPAYQFDGSKVRPEVSHVLKLLRPARLSDEAVVSWFGTGQPELEGSRPADWLGKDPARLYEAARHTAGSLGH